jgi:hypothetical protein
MISMTQVIALEDLKVLRRIGDPGFDRARAHRAERGAPPAPVLGRLAHPPEREVASRAGGVELGNVEPDPDRLLRAQYLFARFGPEIAGALLLAALPQSYAAPWGSGVLVASAGLHRDFRARILGTAQFLLLVTRGAQNRDEAARFWDPAGEATDDGRPAPWAVCHHLRHIHQQIRANLEYQRAKDRRVAGLLGDHNTPPLNQEDLLAMLLTFTVSVFEVLERFGIRWSSDDQDAYLHLWDVIGAHLGIGTPAVTENRELGQTLRDRVKNEKWQGLRPPSIEDTRALLAQLRQRLWTASDLSSASGESSNVAAPTTAWRRQSQYGQILIHALLTELAAAMPTRLRTAPATVVRSLAAPFVRDSLLLGGGGVVTSLADLLPGRGPDTDEFAAPGFRNPLDAKIMRLMANDVTRRATIHFLRSGRLSFPDLDEWSDGLLDPLDIDRALAAAQAAAG